MSPPCVGGRAGGALAKTHVDSQRREPPLGSGGRPLPRRCAPGHRQLSTGVAESPAGRGASKPKRGPGRVTPVCALPPVGG